MEFRIGRAELADAVAWAARALPSRSPVPVLGGLVLAAQEGRLRVSGFDYEVAARIDVPAEVQVPGEALVMGRRLSDICRVLPDGDVACAVEGARLAVEAGGTRFGLSLLPRAEYPEVPEQPAAFGAVDAEEFAAAVAQVAIAAARDETVPVLTGLQLRLSRDEIMLMASDRYQYAVRTIGWKTEDAFSTSTDALVPARRFAEFTRAVARSGLIRLGLHGGLLSLEGAGLSAAMRLLEGRLPRHDKLFTLPDAATAVLDRDALAEAVRRVAVVAEPNSAIRLDFSPTGLLLRAGYADDVASQRLPASLTGADEMPVAFNPTLLLDALNTFATPKIRLTLLGPGQRALLSDATEGDAAEGAATETGTAQSDATETADAPAADHRHLLMSVRQLS